MLAETIAYLVKHRLFINLEREETEKCISQDGGQIEKQKNIHHHNKSLVPTYIMHLPSSQSPLFLFGH